MEFSLGQLLIRELKSIASNWEIFDSEFDPEIRPADERFGDFQANGLLSFLGKRKENPRAMAVEFVKAIKEKNDFSNLFEVSIAGPGFLNFKISDDALLDWLCDFNEGNAYKESFVSKFSNKTVVVDYSSPNSAKQMHVGHLRSMVVGEALQRFFRFGGAKVIRDNHLGDWGTMFGLLLMMVKKNNFSLEGDPDKVIADLEALYKEGNSLIKTDESALEEARRELVKLQNGDEENLRIWKKINEISYNAFDIIYKRMGVSFDSVLGESFYRDMVGTVYEELEASGIAEMSEGALVVFHTDHPRFNKQPFIIRKSDGASNYATNDLATVLHHVSEWKSDAIIYVTDGRQKDHFEQLFLTSTKWFKKTGRPVPEFQHAWVGTILGKDGKAIKTRSGESIKLKELLDEAEERSYDLIREKDTEFSEEEKRKIAEVVGLGSIKYADLSQERTSDYRFDWDKMISFDGNTAPYLLYAIARIYAIFRKLGISPSEFKFDRSKLSITTDAERSLAKKLINFPMVLEMSIEELRPHILCRYLFELAGKFSSFYKADKVGVSDENLRNTRLLLCKSVLSTLETGLNLLGLDTLTKM